MTVHQFYRSINAIWYSYPFLVLIWNEGDINVIFPCTNG